MEEFGRTIAKPTMKLRTIALDVVLLTGWLASVGLVVLHERGQLWGGAGNPTRFLEATLDAKEQWFGLYYQGHKIGFSHLVIMPEERDGIPGVAILDRGRLAFSLLNTPQELDIWFRSFIDADWQIRAFTAGVSSPTYQLKWSGTRQGDALLVSITTPTGTVTKRVHDPTGSAFVSGLSSWAAFHRLRVGQSGKAWVINPLALNPEPVYFFVRRLETVEDTPALVVEAEISGVTTTTWVTPEGEVLKETSPLGWEVRRETEQQIRQGLAERSAPLDLLSATAVPVDRPLDDPEHLERITVILNGATAGDLTVQRSWQTVLPPERLSAYRRTPPEGPWCLLELQRPRMRPTQTATPAPTIQRYQRPSLFVQSDHPAIIDKARAIIGGSSGSWEQVVAVHRWVHQTLTKQLTIGIPSAVDILATPTGDCHEHTILFTALARSLGIPTRMVAGLVYQYGQFFYHAWPEVWLGEWIPTDPTLGQLIADATHIGLIEAENESLISLGQFVGRLRLSVLAVE